jgi:hypothetical protein
MLKNTTPPPLPPWMLSRSLACGEKCEKWVKEKGNEPETVAKEEKMATNV